MVMQFGSDRERRIDIWREIKEAEVKQGEADRTLLTSQAAILENEFIKLPDEEGRMSTERASINEQIAKFRETGEGNIKELIVKLGMLTERVSTRTKARVAHADANIVLLENEGILESIDARMKELRIKANE